MRAPFIAKTRCKVHTVPSPFLPDFAQYEMLCRPLRRHVLGECQAYSTYEPFRR
jgi:hypothetical protein